MQTYIIWLFIGTDIIYNLQLLQRNIKIIFFEQNQQSGSDLLSDEEDEDDDIPITIYTKTKSKENVHLLSKASTINHEDFEADLKHSVI